MELTKVTAIDQILITETNLVNVRQVTRIIENEVVISETYARWVLAKGDDLSGQDERVQKVCNALWA